MKIELENYLMNWNDVLIMKHVRHMDWMWNEYFMTVRIFAKIYKVCWLSSFWKACQKIIHQRYGFSTSTLSSNRSLTPQSISNITVHPSNSLPQQQQQSPVANQVRLFSNNHNTPSSSYVAGNINLAQTAPASVFSSYQYPQEPQPVLVPPTQSFPIAQLAQCFNSQTSNGVLKDRNNQQQQQQQQQQLDKRSRSFKEPTGNKLSTLSEGQSFPGHEGQVLIIFR